MCSNLPSLASTASTRKMVHVEDRNTFTNLRERQERGSKRSVKLREVRSIGSNMVLITEQPPSVLTPQTTPEQLKSIKFVQKDTKTNPSNSETENGGEDRPRRNGKPGSDPQQVADAESDAPESRMKPTLKRSKGIDQASLLQNPSDTEAKPERKKAHSSQLSKTNDQYHKHFKEISKEELLRQSYTCALQKDMLYQGKLYVSDNWICFHSKVFGRGTKIAIPVLSVTLIKKTKTAILVPNAVVIATADERHMFVSFLSRDATYKFLKSVCPHLDAEKLGHGSKPSSTESSFRSERPSSLDFSLDFSDLDGVVRKRRQKDLLESSSSGSQTPDYEKPTEFQGLPQKFFKAMKKGEVAVHADIHLQKGPDPKHGPHRNGHVKPAAELHRGTQLQPPSLNSLLLLYLLLVCILVLSSCYMAFKIMSLEQRLTTLGSLAEYPHNENVLHHREQMGVDSAEIYGELSTNLVKLEKVQRNLRKLLEET
ncbi:hypothetical protein SKAU_G00354540 [Synaphobranchus kaupii]|uniref:GRAM domain-containing protein n=1 Tax=Synaphobranchus kaupii TaxID=118154 RepID=A0A9Q1IEC2_SYNKA|nr:hypothetical protein SKAU_G00354540 [Synaphobranchus kaupii]